MDAILLLVTVLVWLVLMVLTRRHPWALAWWWLPGAAACAGATLYLWVIVDDGSSRNPGPGGGGEAMYGMLVWGMRLALIILCVICALLRPRRA